MTSSKSIQRTFIIFTFVICCKLVLSHEGHHHHAAPSSINPTESNETSQEPTQPSEEVSHDHHEHEKQDGNDRDHDHHHHHHHGNHEVKQNDTQDSNDHDHSHHELMEDDNNDQEVKKDGNQDDHDHHGHHNHHDHKQMSPKDNDHDNSSHEMVNDGHVMMHDQPSSSDDRFKEKMNHDGHAQHMDMNDDKGVHMHMKNGSDMHMIMWFHIAIDQVVLFEQWKIDTVGKLIASMIGIICLGFFYEGLKYFREFLYKRYMSSMQFSTVAVTGESGGVHQIHKVEKHRILSLEHGIQTCLHLVQIVTSYFLMLIFMTYNVWLCLAVVLGAGLGYFIFGWKKATVVDITEHCH